MHIFKTQFICVCTFKIQFISLYLSRFSVYIIHEKYLKNWPEPTENHNENHVFAFAANIAVNELIQIRPQQVLAATAPRAEVIDVSSTPNLQGSRSLAGKRKSQPSHPWRLKAASKRKAVDGKCIYVWLLDFSIEDSGNDYVLDDSMVILKGFVTLNPSDSPKMTSLFQTKFPHIESFQYDFVKRERNKICTPTTERSFSWNFFALKNLWGQGKLYCRLNVTRNIVEEGTESDDDTESYSSSDVKNIWHPASGTQPSTSATWSSTSAQHSTSNTPPLTSATHPSTSATHSSTSATHPSTSATHSSTSATHPSTSATYPSTSASHPSTSATHPSTSAIHPSTSATHPSTSSTKHSTNESQMLDDNANRVSE